MLEKCIAIWKNVELLCFLLYSLQSNLLGRRFKRVVVQKLYKNRESVSIKKRGNHLKPNNCLFVELVGFEPTSKQGNHTLSTCLFWPSVFVTQQDPDHQLRPYPLKLHPCGEAHTGYFRFTCTALSSDSEQHPWSDVSFHQTLWRNKANLLYFD